MRSVNVGSREHLSEVEHGYLGRGFWARWVLASAVAVSVGSTIGGIVGEAAHGVIFETLGFTVVGAVVGTLQWLALRRYVRQTGWYAVATMGGYSLVGLAAGTMGWIFGGETGWGMVGAEKVAVRFAVGGTVAGVVVGAWLGTVDGIMQWVALRRHVSAWFIAASAMGEAVGGATSFTLAAAIGLSVGEIMRAAPVFIVGGAAGGAVTGLALVLMFTRTSVPKPAILGRNRPDLLLNSAIAPLIAGFKLPALARRPKAVLAIAGLQ